MANEKNLKPLNKRTKSEQREIQTKGGKASGEARRKRKQVQKDLEAALSCNVVYNGDMVSAQEALISSVIAKGIRNGDYRTLETIARILGEDTKTQIIRERLEEYKRINGIHVQEQAENNLFEAIDSIGEEGFDDLPEIQQAAENDAPMVENEKVPK